jgi:hypothetical protein
MHQLMFSELSTKDWLILGFFGFWGAVACGVLLKLAYYRMRNRNAPEPSPQGVRPRRRAP